MSVLECKDALFDLINDNKHTLVLYLQAQSTQREIRQINKEILAPPREYYCVWINVGLAAYGQESGGAGASTTWAEYDCQIEFVDFAIPQGGEQGLYEEMGEDFSLLLDRTVDLLIDNALAITSTAGVKFRLVQSLDPNSNRRIEVERRDTYATENQFSGPFFYGVIRFRLGTDCVDFAGLY